MKTALLLTTFLIFSAAPAFAQTQPVSTASDDTSRSDSNQHNYGWIGLIGLLGLAGLRRQKSPEHERMESAGVNVKTVRTTPH